MREILFRGKRKDNGEWVESGSIVRIIYDEINWGYYIGAGKPALYAIDSGGNIHGAIVADENALVQCETMDECIFYNVDPETVGQYTGLTDKNGKRIFEGDVVEYGEEFGKIAYHNSEAMFAMEFDIWCTDFDHIYPREVEVIGNIHDNPELIGGGE